MKRIQINEVQPGDVVSTERGLVRVDKVERGYMQPEFARLDGELRDGQAATVILRSDKDIMLHFRSYPGSAKSWYQFLADTQEQLDDVDASILRLNRPRNAEDRQGAEQRLREDIPALMDKLEELLLSLKPLE